MAKFIIKGHFGQAVNCRNAVSEQKNKELIKRLNELKEEAKMKLNINL